MIATKRESETLIGKCNWIGNRTSINKDYTQNEENFIILGRSPAEVLISGLKRIFSTKIEKYIITFSTIVPKKAIMISLLDPMRF